MTLNEIIQAVKAGKTVCWSNDNYVITGNPEKTTSLLITSQFNNHSIGLTWLDGETMNGKEGDFYIKDYKESCKESYSVTLTKEGVLYSTAVYDNKAEARQAVKQVVETMGAELEEESLEGGCQEVGAFTVYCTLNGDTDSLLTHFAEAK